MASSLLALPALGLLLMSQLPASPSQLPGNETANWLAAGMTGEEGPAPQSAAASNMAATPAVEPVALLVAAPQPAEPTPQSVIPPVARQAHHQRNQEPAVRPEPVEARPEPSRRGPASGTQSSKPATPASYYARVQQQLAAAAGELPAGLRGEARLRFTVQATGGVAGVRVVQSSGHAELDAAAMALLAKTAPLPVPPNGELVLEVPIRAE